MEDTKDQVQGAEIGCTTGKSKQRCLLLISSCLIQLMTGQLVSGPVFANYMKLSYELNQRQLDFCVSLMYLGTVLILISGLFYDRFGARASIFLSGVLSTLTMIFLAIAMARPEPLRQRVWLLYILLFLHGHSFNYGYVAAIGCCMSSFQSNRRLFIMSLLDNCFSLGPPVVAFIYYVIFDNMHRSVDDQRPVGTRIVLLVMNLAIHVFAFFFLTRLDHDSPDENEPDESKHILDGQRQLQRPQPKLQQTSGSAVHEVPSSTESVSGSQQQSPDNDFLAQTRDFLTVCCSTRLLPLLFGVALSIGSNLMTFLNLTSVTRSLSLTQYDVYYFWFPTLVGVAWRCLIGQLIDQFLPRASQQSAVLLVSVACFGAPSTLLLSTPLLPGVSPIGVTIVAYVFDSINNATLFTMTPVIISQTEQRHLFGRLYSLCLLIASLIGLILILQFGALYDAQVRPASGNLTGFVNTTLASTTVAGEQVCLGYICYMYGGMASTVCQFVSIVCLIYYYVSLRLANL